MRRGRTLILLGLILALGTAGAIFVLLQGTTATPPEAQVERVEVVVAMQPIAEDEPVAGRLELRAMPVDTIPTGALRTLDGTSDMLAAGPIPQGTIIQQALLISPVQLMAEGDLGTLVEPGFVAVAMPIDELSSVSYGVRPDDHVDILMTFHFVDIDPETQLKEPICPPVCPCPAECPTQDQATELQLSDQIPRLASQLTLQDIRVLGVGRWEMEEVLTAEETQQQQQGQPVAPELPAFITLMVTPQDALVLKLAREAGASIDLAVRAEDDVQQFVTQQVTLDYLMARFSIGLPTKQAYTIQELRSVPGELQ
ncbi:MAG: Flp pilus assembly protein CpaB [Anaerolineae bacterium]|nr:Flp pilus assembly protein CpaB [Anaerolineae bacterium]MDX9831905.1 Flp pilus assembly protein CpaB [Anaerolineae bacterium]